ncbi:actin binding [Euphorbia peplus]|nr:actin binding [Euphorbia peplus]
MAVSLLQFLLVASAATYTSTLVEAACKDCFIQSRATYSPISTGNGPSDSGACGFGSFGATINDGDVSSVSNLYRDGVGCGACYHVRCRDSKLCRGEGVTVVVTSSGSSHNTDFILSRQAFARMALNSNSADALFSQGVIDVEYKRVPCSYPGKNITIKIDENSHPPHYLAFAIWFQQGNKDITAVLLCENENWGCKVLDRSYGGIWTTTSVPSGTLSLRMLFGSEEEDEETWIVPVNTIPQDWKAGDTYDTGVQPRLDRRRRMVPPDRLLEISERLYVFDCCLSTDVLEEDAYKDYLGGITSQLQDYHPDASFMVFNFREGDKRSHISDILSEYDITVMDYPRHYERCPVLPLEMIHHFLRSCECWLSMGQVSLMHCERGGWPVFAFMLTAVLLYLKQSNSEEQKTLEMVHNYAPKELLLLSPLNPHPSQLRYLNYISTRNVWSDWPPSGTPLVLDSLILRNLPLFELGGSRGCSPLVRVYGQDASNPADRISKLLFSTKNDVRCYQEEESMVVKIDVHCRVQGDVVLECVHLDEHLVGEEMMMFRVMFHTAYVRDNNLTLGRDDIDTLWDYKDRFSDDFKTEVLFSDADAFVPTLTTVAPNQDGLERVSPEE